MNKLSTEKRSQIVAALVEGNSILSIVRMTGASKNTIAKLLVELGAACVRIPSDADQRSEVMAIAIANSCRSRFRDDGDRDSDGKPITFRRFSEW